MNYWLIKSEPSVYSWEQFKKDKKTSWTGIRSYAARNNLRSMKSGDELLFYHSNEGLCIVGIAKVCREHYQDPTTEEIAWLCVDIEPYKDFTAPVSLAQIKIDKSLKNMQLIKIGRLSVSVVTKAEFDKVCKMGGV